MQIMLKTQKMRFIVYNYKYYCVTTVSFYYFYDVSEIQELPIIVKIMTHLQDWIEQYNLLQILR